MEPRKYTEQEVGELLSRAAALQSRGSGSEGTTLVELQRVAAELGIDPSSLATAANQLDYQRSQVEGINSNSILFEQSVDGEMSDENWDRLVTAMRAHTGKAGTSESSLGATREWKGGDAEAYLLSATNRNGRVQLRLLADMSGWAGMLCFFGFIGGFLACFAPMVIQQKTGALGGAFFTVLLTIAVALAAAMLTSIFVRRARVKYMANARVLMDKLVVIAESDSVIAEGVVMLERPSEAASRQSVHL